MGKGYSISCECGYNDYLNYGIGFLYPQFCEDLEKSFNHEPEKYGFKQEDTQKEYFLDKEEYTTYYCKACKLYETKEHFIFHSKDSLKKRHPKYKCPQCSGNMI